MVESTVPGVDAMAYTPGAQHNPSQRVWVGRVLLLVHFARARGDEHVASIGIRSAGRCNRGNDRG